MVKIYNLYLNFVFRNGTKKGGNDKAEPLPTALRKSKMTFKAYRRLTNTIVERKKACLDLRRANNK